MTDPPWTTTHWDTLALPPEVHVVHLADYSPGVITIAGGRDGAAFAAQLRYPEGALTEITVPEEAAALGPVRTLKCGDNGVLGVCGDIGLWGLVALVDDDHLGPVDAPDYLGTRPVPIELPRDEHGARASWVWITAGAGHVQAIAAYANRAGHEIRALDIGTHQLMPVEQPLITAAPLETLQVAAFGGRVTVAGPVTGPDALTSWWGPSYHPDPAQDRDPLPWLSNEFEEPPTRLSGSIDWDAMSFYVGTREDQTVALWDSTGELRETTGIGADLNDPIALLAELDPWGELDNHDAEGLAAFAIKATDGNVLRFLHENHEMPPGRLQSVVLNRGFDRPRCFALIDGTVHVAALDYKE
jgi:hypothetical protein